MVCLSFLLSHVVLIVFKRFWSSLSDLHRRWACLEKNNGGMCLIITVRHCLILVIVRDYLAPPHGPAGGSGSVPNHSGGWIESFNALFLMESQWRAPDTVNFASPSFLSSRAVTHSAWNNNNNNNFMLNQKFVFQVMNMGDTNKLYGGHPISQPSIEFERPNLVCDKYPAFDFE